MISKNSFSSLMKEDMKTRMWLVLLNNIILFLNFPIAIAVEIQRVQEMLKEAEYFQRQNAVETLAHSLGAGNWMTVFLVACMAFLAAISQFGYLYQKSQVDLYHSLPISRKRSFFTRFLNGIIVYILPYVLYMVIGIVLITASGFGQMEIIQAAMSGFMIHFIGYLLCYSTAILAVCLTGNIFTGVCGIATFCGYGVLVAFFSVTMLSSYFKTYVTEYGKAEELFYYLSPVGAYVKLSDLADGNNSDSSIVMWSAGCIAGIIVLTFLAYMVYKNRKSENAGKSIAFSNAKGIIKVFLITMITCLGTLMFGSFGYGAENIWRVIGFVISLLLSHILIQIIYELDVKAIRKGLVSTGVSAGLGILIFAGFYFGGKVYDNHQINLEKVDYAAIGMGTLLYGGDCYYDEEEDLYIYYGDYALEYMQLEDKELIQEYVQACIQDNKQDENGTRISFKFALKNGKEAYRQYVVNYDTTRKYIPKLMENQQFRQGINHIFKVDAEKIDYVNYYTDWNGYDTKRIDISKEEMAVLFETYKEEYLAASYEDLNENAPVLCFVPCINGKYNNGEEICRVYVYPTFAKTLALLEEAGVKPLELKTDDITEISIAKWGEIKNEGTEDESIVPYEESITVSYEKPEEIEELIKVISLGDYGFYTNFDGDRELKNQYEITVSIKSGKNGIDTAYGIFIEDIPDWLEEDIKNKAIEKEIEGVK